ncbi:MAG: superoxide dismutase [Paludibacter sp.]|nr:superoxide dismutase [Paludibacter sp.]
MRQTIFTIAIWFAATIIGFAQFKLPTLPYSYSALEPYIDSTTMYIHLNKHHAAYTNKLNKAIEENPSFKGKTIEELFSAMKMMPKSLKEAVREAGGGYYNHCIFWESLAPAGTAPMSPELEKIMNENFGSVDNFKQAFEKIALDRFGSGWAWMIKMDDGKLKIVTTANQDNTLMSIIGLHAKPILGLDLWEHAYYLKYQADRKAYIDAFWNVVNWKHVEEAIK